MEKQNLQEEVNNSDKEKILDLKKVALPSKHFLGQSLPRCWIPFHKRLLLPQDVQ
jgi:hypothetical protein